MDYKDLKIWQKGFSLTEKVYELTNSFPKKEQYSLTDQIRRAAISVPSNIAEGFGRASKKHFHSFLRISLGSLSELETQIMLSKSVGYTKDIDEIIVLISEIQKMIGKIISKSCPKA